MTPTEHKQWLINDRPLGRPLADNDFKLVTSPVQEPGDGEVLMKTLFLGFDPALKGWMENIGGYVAPTEIGEVMRGSGICEVIKSNHPKFKPGDKVAGLTGWQEYPCKPGGELEKIKDETFMTAQLGVLGTPGMTAYFGLLRIGQPIAGDTVVVSGAAGATGSVVGQIAKLMGCRTVGIAGGPEKCRWLIEECGYDAAIDYKSEKVRQRLREECPRGIDVFFDNVGGTILNDALSQLAHKARVVICGGISRYQVGQLPSGPEHYFNLIFRRAKMEGFIVLDYMSEYGEARARMIEWIKAGKLAYKEDIQEGFDNAPKTLQRLFDGENFGKQLLKVAD